MIGLARLSFEEMAKYEADGVRLPCRSYVVE